MNSQSKIGIIERSNQAFAFNLSRHITFLCLAISLDPLQQEYRALCSPKNLLPDSFPVSSRHLPKTLFSQASAYYLCFSEMCSIIIWICFQAQGHAQVFLICKKSLKHLLGEEKIRDKTTLCFRLPLHVSSNIGNREKCQLYNHPNVMQISCCCAKFFLG